MNESRTRMLDRLYTLKRALSALTEEDFATLAVDGRCPLRRVSDECAQELDVCVERLDISIDRNDVKVLFAWFYDYDTDDVMVVQTMKGFTIVGPEEDAAPRASNYPEGALQGSVRPQRVGFEDQALIFSNGRN